MNDEAERQFRGGIHFADLRTVIQTARNQGWNAFDILAHSDPSQLISLLHHPPY